MYGIFFFFGGREVLSAKNIVAPHSHVQQLATGMQKVTNYHDSYIHVLGLLPKRREIRQSEKRKDVSCATLNELIRRLWISLHRFGLLIAVNCVVRA